VIEYTFRYSSIRDIEVPLWVKYCLAGRWLARLLYPQKLSWPLRGGVAATFPTLNGIGLLFAQSPDAQSKASSMMPMIPLNGVLFLISTTLLLDHLVCQNEDVMRHFDA
jgi:hypothetical protein